MPAANTPTPGDLDTLVDTLVDDLSAELDELDDLDEDLIEDANGQTTEDREESLARLLVIEALIRSNAKWPPERGSLNLIATTLQQQHPILTRQEARLRVATALPYLRQYPAVLKAGLEALLAARFPPRPPDRSPRRRLLDIPEHPPVRQRLRGQVPSTRGQ